jgi:hypothetical protein
MISLLHPEDGGSKVLRNVTRRHNLNVIVLQARRIENKNDNSC